MSTQIQDVDGLVEALQTKTKALHTSSDPDESRKAALAAAREVVAALEKPEEVAMRYASIVFALIALEPNVPHSIY